MNRQWLISDENNSSERIESGCGSYGGYFR